MSVQRTELGDPPVRGWCCIEPHFGWILADTAFSGSSTRWSGDRGNVFVLLGSGHTSRENWDEKILDGMQFGDLWMGDNEMKFDS